jgi:hypothetical protein
LHRNGPSKLLEREIDRGEWGFVERIFAVRSILVAKRWLVEAAKRNRSTMRRRKAQVETALLQRRVQVGRRLWQFGFSWFL